MLAREQSALQRVATSVAVETNPAILFARVAQQASLLLGAECGYVLRFVDDEQYKVIGSWGRRGARMLDIGQVGTQTPDGLGVELRRGRTAKRRSVSKGTQPFDYLHRIGAPILVGGEPWGMLVAMRDRSGPFPPDDEKRIARFAQLASVAVANADAREHLATQALTDPLTELANRRAFDQRLAEETERALRHGRDLSLILVDVDHFKNINDRFGHATGDRVLVNLARNIEAVMRHGDLLARVGGDEMAMILGDCPPGQAAEVAHRMLVGDPELEPARPAPRRDAVDRRRGPRARRLSERAAAPRRPGAVPRQGRRPQPRRLLRRADGRRPHALTRGGSLTAHCSDHVAVRASGHDRGRLHGPDASRLVRSKRTAITCSPRRVAGAARRGAQDEAVVDEGDARAPRCR